MLEVFLIEATRFWSEDTTGELLFAALEIFCSAPGLTSVVRTREGSDSVPNIIGSRLLETAGRLEDPLDRRKLELDNCMSQKTYQVTEKVGNTNKWGQIHKNGDAMHITRLVWSVLTFKAGLLRLFLVQAVRIQLDTTKAHLLSHNRWQVCSHSTCCSFLFSLVLTDLLDNWHFSQ